MVLQLVLASALVAAALANQGSFRPHVLRQTYIPPQPTYGAPAPSYDQPQQATPPKYQFDWTVNDAPSGNNHGHQEARDGSDTQGSYYVQLPDGRLQRVDYSVSGDSGFVAKVTYEGEAQHPQQNHGPAPSPPFIPPAPSPPFIPPAPTYGPDPSHIPAPSPSFIPPAPTYGPEPSPFYDIPAPSPSSGRIDPRSQPAYSGPTPSFG